ncbi:MAG: V-type ATP synthase subunit A [Candidatus Aminicenantes bacterium]|nr:V-type ATP synthase subunit A [Candidatus Aminicenantes bacterium]
MTGHITGINGNMLTASFEGAVTQNEVGFAISGDERLKAEVIRIRGNTAFLQVFESAKGLRVGDPVEFTGELLSVHLGPGLLGQIYDGLQNPLPRVAERYGYFLPRGVVLNALDPDKAWAFEPLVKPGDVVRAGAFLGSVPETQFRHHILVPFDWAGEYTVVSVRPAGPAKLPDVAAVLRDGRGEERACRLSFDWPIKIPIRAYREKFLPNEPLTTKVRIIDTFFPVAKGGTYCIPGPFGAGKTVLQQITSRNADIDIVIIAACGERAGEIVETMREFPTLTDPRTGRSLMERTIIIANTSSMPVAAREASVYTAATLGEYYRQQGLDVLLLADSTSRWAQAMREVSGRLEEIPGEEAFPAYLESRIAEFYERSGLVELESGGRGSLTIGGTVSPAGGNFEEPVTQATLKVVGAFHGLSRERSDARRYPAIHPLDSWSKYAGPVSEGIVHRARKILAKGAEVHQMMMVVGEEGTSLDDFIVYLKSEFLDAVYLQQNAFDPVDAATPPARQQRTAEAIDGILEARLDFADKERARSFFHDLRRLFLDQNALETDAQAFLEKDRAIRALLDGAARHA